MPYTPPVGRYGTVDAEHDAYMEGHQRGWQHAGFVAAYAHGDSGVETHLNAAERHAAERYAPDTRTYLRAVGGFTDGAEQFDSDDHDD